MPEYLTFEAAGDYLGLSQASRSLRLIGRTLFLERLLVLVRIADPSDPAVAYAAAVLLAGDWPTDDENWEYDLDEAEQSHSVGQVGVDDDHMMYFMTTAGGLKNWFFRPGDPDFFPSVPHGHFENRDNPKLDAYLGWTYMGPNQTGRVSRRSIVALWNDEKFRSIAALAIEYYLDNYPYHRWRVSYPKRLPRRRRL